MATDDIITLGAANMQARTRTSKSGKSTTRYTVTVSGDSLLINTDPKSLGKGPAEAISALIKERITSITDRASDATNKARENAAKAFAAGKPWAIKRYGGGRIGSMPPNQSDKGLN